VPVQPVNFQEDILQRGWVVNEGLDGMGAELDDSRYAHGAGRTPRPHPEPRDGRSASWGGVLCRPRTVVLSAQVRNRDVNDPTSRPGV
jgi:hypothetical protein